MPPVSNIRKPSAMTHTGEPSNPYHLPNPNPVSAPRRTTASGRAIRTNTTRPTNYYARPYLSMHSAGMDLDTSMDHMSMAPPGFFPALTYFTDAITALPKEVMKQFTLMKEVEAKIHGPAEKIGELVDAIMAKPVQERKSPCTSTSDAPIPHAMLSLTANNSISGSANPSVVNGVAGRSARASVSVSLPDGEMLDNEDERDKRRKCHELRVMTSSLMANLDEKIVVLSEASRVLALQHTRLDSVMPYVNEEISEEARMGSMTHWAYSDNRQKTKTAANVVNRPRDVVNTNNLAAAANMIHEAEIAQVRTNAGKEATREKGKGKRTEHAVDSDFDDKPRKAPKLGKGKAAAATSAGLGISANGEPTAVVKRRKLVDKGLAAPGMERSISAPSKGAKGRDTPRSTPAADLPAVAKTKVTKAKALPPPVKKRMPGSAQASPMLASSPLAASFNPATMEVPAGIRPQSSRMRQNSAATNLRHEQVQDEDSAASRPSSAGGKVADKVAGRKKIQETTEMQDEQTGDEMPRKMARNQSDRLKGEDIDVPDSERGRSANSRSGSNSRKNSGRTSKVGTPRTDSFPANAGGESAGRARSVRKQQDDRDTSSSEPRVQGAGPRMHKRMASNSHLVKQLAPFNKSPNMNRDKDDMEDSLDSDDKQEEEREEVAAEAEDEGEDEARTAARRSATRRPVSRRNTASSVQLRNSPGPVSPESSPPASPPPSARQNTRSSQRATTTAASPPQESEPPALEPDDELDSSEEHEGDPDDPDDPLKYCYCNRGSYGEMIACDNEQCTKEWFHLGCTELREAPDENESWFCRDCRPRTTGRGRGGRGRGVGRGGGGAGH